MAMFLVKHLPFYKVYDVKTSGMFERVMLLRCSYAAIEHSLDKGCVWLARLGNTTG